MSVHFNAYPVTADMGLRESINAMLSHVAYAGHDFGYLPSALHQANYETLADDFSDVLTGNGSTLTVAPVITDSDSLAYLVETLLGLCNGYPAYNDERVSEIEHERVLDSVREVLTDMQTDGKTLPNATAEEITYALYEISAYIEQSEYGAAFSDADLAAAIAHAERENEIRSHEENGLFPLI